MRKIINGVRYNTEKSQKIGTHHHGAYPQSGDFSHWTASLYKTPRSGRYFLHGEGGAMTRFAHHPPSGGTCGGEKVIPLDPADAMEWAERHLDTDIVGKFFSDMIEDA